MTPVNLRQMLQDLASGEQETWTDSALSSEILSVADVPMIKTPADVFESGTGSGGMGRFQLRGELGRGGMGKVLLAYDPELKREVALKVIINSRSISRALLARFIAEAQITSQLEHPNIVPVHEMGISDEGELFFVMKRVIGQPLREIISGLAADAPEETRRWSRHRLLTAFVQVCNGVAYAHQRGVLHRDLKPDNVMVGGFGEVLVMDWGLARLIGDRDELLQRVTVERVQLTQTAMGVVIGTPGYMSPEQSMGRIHDLTPRSDVWSLGAILYELLTYTPAYPGDSVHDLLFIPCSRPPVPPTERRPEFLIPEEISQICLAAMSIDPGARHPTAGELAGEIEAFLEGSAKKARADKQLSEGRHRLAAFYSLREEKRQLQEREASLKRILPTWAPLRDKADLLRIQDRLEEIEIEEGSSFSEVIGAGERALSHVPEHREAREFLAQAWWERFLEAERRGERTNQTLFAERIRAYDTGHFDERLRGDGHLSLTTTPPGAVVLCQRVQASGLQWGLSAPEHLGTTPISTHPMARGSYLLTLRHPGRRDTLYPVHITRGRHWEGQAAVPLFTDAEIGAEYLYVPAGPARLGGDPSIRRQLPSGDEWIGGFFISRFPVTVQQYCEFLNHLHAIDPESAWARLPAPGPTRRPGLRFWLRKEPDERYEVPTVDTDGDLWLPDWPIFGISWDDAMAYAQWRRGGLPTERQWTKAARGVDGRYFPWGNRFDAVLCHTPFSRPSRPLPEPVGTFSGDQSIYGVRDMAGLIREWCADPSFDDDPERRPVRGGSYMGSARLCRLANRFGYEPDVVEPYLGFRLVRPLPC